MSSNPKISVIVPFFNAESTIGACLNSALGQTFTSIEIICVDDASGDQSSGIVKEFARRDQRISLITHEKNQGQSQARNTGITRASGAYLAFLDADDQLPPDALQCLYDTAVTHSSELVKGDFLWFTSPAECSRVKSLVALSPAINTNIRESAYLQTIPGSHCANLYSRELLDRHGIRYESLTQGEDQVFQAKALVNARSVTVIDDVVYQYHHYRSTSVTSSLPSLENLVDDVRYYRAIAELLLEAGLKEAGLAFVTDRWSFPISAYWSKIPQTLTLKEASTLFDEFRAFVKNFGLVPWCASTPIHHRYVLALVMAGYDQEAYNFLATKEASRGFR